MKEGRDVPCLEGRDSQLLLEFTPERILDALPGLDVAAWQGDGAWYHPLRGLPRSSASTVASVRTTLRIQERVDSLPCYPSPESLTAESLRLTGDICFAETTATKFTAAINTLSIFVFAGYSISLVSIASAYLQSGIWLTSHQRDSNTFAASAQREGVNHRRAHGVVIQ
jgi:hypothetical protein